MHLLNPMGLGSWNPFSYSSVCGYVVYGHRESCNLHNRKSGVQYLVYSSTLHRSKLHIPLNYPVDAPGTPGMLSTYLGPPLVDADFTPNDSRSPAVSRPLPPWTWPPPLLRVIATCSNPLIPNYCPWSAIVTFSSASVTVEMSSNLNDNMSCRYVVSFN